MCPKRWRVVTNIKDEACFVCHKVEPPLEHLALDQRKRIIPSDKGYRMMGIISPIYNEPGCSQSCHFHPEDKTVLGALDVVVSLKKTDQQIAFYEKGLIFFTMCLFLACSSIIIVFVLRFVHDPIQKVIQGTRQISSGTYGRIEGLLDGEMRQLARAINQMAEEIDTKQRVLNEQRKEYQQLFESVPCLITVQNKDFQLLQYNREFGDRFHPEVGDLCYQVYKNRAEPCVACPVMATFKDGLPHNSEQSGVTRTGKATYWALRTAPITDSDGNVTAVMEISMDITRIRSLEKEVRKSEEKYRVIFDHIPNPLFVLDEDTLVINDCNASAEISYGYSRDELIGKSFEAFFDPEYSRMHLEKIKQCQSISKVRQIGKDKEIIFVDIHVSKSEYLDDKVLLVNATDITEQLIAEQQLIQASKMATLGEMATGVAHELNQPLSVIKSAGNYILRKVKAGDPIAPDIMVTMTEEIDGQVNRASKIINHMREFGRKSDAVKEKADVNRALIKAFDIFREQLKLRQIEVVQELYKDLPMILADENRLEQVFINLLINARDAIEDRCEKNEDNDPPSKQIFLTSRVSGQWVVIEIEDTGTGIPATIADKIFDPFFTTKEAGKGTGLGLSIGYGIIKDYGGSITVKTGQHNGALFVIRFPSIVKDGVPH